MHMTWQTKKSVINNPFTKNTIGSILFNNNECTNDKLIAEAFGKLYSEISGVLEPEIP